MMRPLTTLCRIAPAVCLIAVSACVVNAAPPNVVILLADDLGWADVSYHADRVRTPHIDKLVKEGVELDRFYVCPMCSPTRAGLMTGRYPIRYGLSRAVIPPWRDFGLDTSEVTLPQVLAKTGYKHRGMFGKWHLGHRRAEWHPLSRGFTHFHGHYNGAIDYFTHERDGQRDWHVNWTPTAQEGYSTDLTAAAAARFIEQHADDGPFFCYVPFNAPHSPFQAPQRYLDQYAQIENQRQRTLAAMIACMDDGIGRILAAIDKAGVRDNTLVWFLSDNGGVGGVKDNNLPLRGSKLSVFEGGVRVPAAVRWPGGLKGGRKVSAPLSVYDILPTLMRIAGVKDHGGKPLDGADAFDVLVGKTAELDRELYFYHGQSGPEDELLAVIDGKWKLVILGPDVRRGGYPSAEHRVMLFDIAADPYEKRDVSDQHVGVVGRLAAKLVAFRRLQPKGAVSPYGQGRRGFAPPPNWRLDPP